MCCLSKIPNQDREISLLQKKIAITRDDLSEALLNLGRYIIALGNNDVQQLAMLNYFQKNPGNSTSEINNSENNHLRASIS